MHTPTSKLLHTSNQQLDPKPPTIVYLTMEETISLVNRMAAETSYKHVYRVMQSQSLRDSLCVPFEIWAHLEPALRTKIDNIRKEIRDASARPNSADARRSTPPNDETLPDQYPSRATQHTQALNTSVELDLDEMDDVSENTDSDDDSVVDDTILRCLLNVRTLTDDDAHSNEPDLEVRAHFEYVEPFKDAKDLYAISDGGADSCVLGHHAYVTDQDHTGRYATLVGYDPKSTRSHRIPIVSALLKVTAHNGIPVLLRVNEAPYYANNPVTLLSEYQIRENHYVIDSVASKHKRSAKENGTQCFELNSDVHLPFEDRGGIMGIKLLPITKDDFDEHGEPLYDVFEITSLDKWVPAWFRNTLHSKCTGHYDPPKPQRLPAKPDPPTPRTPSIPTHGPSNESVKNTPNNLFQSNNDVNPVSTPQKVNHI